MKLQQVRSGERFGREHNSREAAEQHGRVVGHIMYSPRQVAGLIGAALGPKAVAPEDQGHGIGTQLVETGNKQLADNGCPCIAMVGHPTFYPRFGFQPASSYRITCDWDVPDEAFMVVVLMRRRCRASLEGHSTGPSSRPCRNDNRPPNMACSRQRARSRSRCG